MFESIRVRLTLWHLSVLALVLVAFSLTVYAMLAQSLRERLDSTLRAEVRALSAAIEREVAQGRTAREAAAKAQAERFFPRQATAVYDEAGQVVAESPTRSGKHARLPALHLVPADDTYFYTIREEEDGGRDGRRVAVKRVAVKAAGHSFIFAVSQPLDRVAEELASMRRILYLAVPLALTFAGLGGWFLARRSLAPVSAMSAQARRIGAENLQERLPVTNPRDELGQLAATFNELLARLAASFEQQRRFMADASHELRTPLSVMCTAADVTLGQEHRDEREYRDALRVQGEQARRLSRIVEDMFTLARADDGRPSLQPADFYLDELIDEVGRAASVLGGRQGVTVEVGAAPETPYRGDEGLLRQMLLNLLDNAIKHTPPGGSVRLSFERHDSHFYIPVADTGAGIPAEAQPHVFERFYRADRARARAAGANGSGAGLGLSIARWIAEVHGGRLELRRSDPSGSTFVVTLPASPALK